MLQNVIGRSAVTDCPRNVPKLNKLADGRPGDFVSRATGSIDPPLPF
jgi:hypothetical protein